MRLAQAGEVPAAVFSELCEFDSTLFFSSSRRLLSQEVAKAGANGQVRAGQGA